MESFNAPHEKTLLSRACACLFALVLFWSGPCSAQGFSRTDVTDAGRLWIGTVAPPLFPGGGAAFRDRLERTSAEMIVRAAEQSLLGQKTASGIQDGGVAVCGFGDLTPEERGQAIGMWLGTHDLSADVQASFEVSERGCVTAVRIVSAPSEEAGKIVAACLLKSRLWIPARRLRRGVRRPEVSQHSVVVRASRLRALLGGADGGPDEE